MQAFHLDKETKELVGVIEPIKLEGFVYYEVTRPQEHQVYITGVRENAPGLAKGTHKKSIWDCDLTKYSQLKAKGEELLSRYIIGDLS